MTIKTHLCIKNLELYVHLGWPTKEQEEAQSVLLDLEFFFPSPPKACLTDDLKDTVCYSALIDALQNKLAKKKFHLIEYLSQEIYAITKPLVPDKTKLIVRVAKRPDIQGLNGGVTFSYADETS